MPRRKPNGAAPSKDPGAPWPRGRYRLDATQYLKASPDAEWPMVLPPGTEIIRDRPPNMNMTPLDAAAEKGMARYLAEREAIENGKPIPPAT